jgi:hypothetical protein
VYGSPLPVAVLACGSTSVETSIERAKVAPRQEGTPELPEFNAFSFRQVCISLSM